MSHQIAAGDYDEKSGHKHKNKRQCVFRVGSGHCSIPRQKERGTGIIDPHYATVLNLRDIEFPVTMNQIEGLHMSRILKKSIFLHFLKVCNFKNIVLKYY